MIEELYEKLYIELLRWCTNMCGNIHLAEELVQEAFLKATANQENLQSLTYKQQRAWLYKTARNLFVDHYRKYQRELLSSFTLESKEGRGNPLNQLMEDSREEEILWNMLIASLSEQERTPFIMRYLMGYTSNEIGDMFNISPATVRSRLHNARKRIRKELGIYTKGE